MKCQIQVRRPILVNLDPHSRCYNGCFPSSEMQWTEWEEVYTASSKERAEDAIRDFSKINVEREYRMMEVCDAL